MVGPGEAEMMPFTTGEMEMIPFTTEIPKIHPTSITEMRKTHRPTISEMPRIPHIISEGTTIAIVLSSMVTALGNDY